VKGKQRVARLLVSCGLAGALLVGAANGADAEARKARKPTKAPPAQTYKCKKGNKTVKATSKAAAATACRGYGGLK
jgi:hypothetical protein